MKRFLLVLLILCVLTAWGASSVYGQDVIRNANGTVDVAWDAPDNVQDGTVPATEVTYELYTAVWSVAVAAPEDVAQYTLVGTVSDTFYDGVDITVYGEEDIALGVRAVRREAGQPAEFTGMHWSFLGGVPVPFILQYREPLAPVTRIRLK